VSSAAGLSLDAQPAALTDWVSRNGFVSGMEALYRVARERSSGVSSLTSLASNSTICSFLPLRLLFSFATV